MNSNTLTVEAERLRRCEAMLRCAASGAVLSRARLRENAVRIRLEANTRTRLEPLGEYGQGLEPLAGLEAQGEADQDAEA